MILALVLSVASVAGFALLAAARGSWSAVAGDESTFLAMAESLAVDGDLEFSKPDAERLWAVEVKARKSVILQRSGGRIGYSKPVVYPLLAAPFFKILGRPGLVIFNGLALGGALCIFWLSVRRSERRGAWALTIATFAATGAVLPQIAWSTGDALQLALALAGTTLAVGEHQGRARPSVGGLLLGLLVGMRLPNAILAVAVLAAVAVSKRRGGVGMALQVVIGVLLVSVLNAGLTGAANPYKAERATFNSVTGYPVGSASTFSAASPADSQTGAGGRDALGQFVAGRATQRLGIRPDVRPRFTAYATLYFLVGRHTGVLWYFPVSLVLLAAALRTAGRERWPLLLGVLGSVGFYLVWMPENYFGGASFVGNRYILPALAAVLVTVRRPPRPRALLAVWALFAVLLGSALLSIRRERGQPFSSQSHAYAGLARLLPYESTALSIENREDRYLSDEFVRFVDRNARVSDHGFHLQDGAEPAEILLATPRPSGVLRFLVLSDAPAAELVYRDWGGEQRFELSPHPSGSGRLIELVAMPAWRRHPFWFSDESWRAHSFRLALETGSGGDARADVRYLGPYRLATKFFAYELLRLELPDSAVAGTETLLPIRLVNRGPRPWASDADVPVHIVHRLVPATVDDAPSELHFTDIRKTVSRGGQLARRIAVRWPDTAGNYSLEIDLAVAGVELFQGWVGAPLASGVVEVVPAGSR